MGKSIAALAALGALLPGAILAQEVADRIWTGGSVVTIDSDNTVAEGIAVKGRQIIAVGSRDTVMQHAGPETEVVDLAGKTLIPGFVDPTAISSSNR